MTNKAKREGSAHAFEESPIYEEVQPLIGFLKAPANLLSLDKVLPDFDDVLTRFLPIADDSALGAVAKLQHIIRGIDDKTLNIWPYVPKC